ncbi:MAG: deoxyribose-phosphate aldolase, partial [Gramella sp.]|nr:deoxyribose-phosphate aldolase [Christiangramia sp.]
YGLNAEAANKELIGKDTIAGREYYEVKVTFSENGGGTDHEDEYLYWIDIKNFEVDYLAYNFEENGGGVRFRKAFNHRVVEGIRFVDYENYKYKDIHFPLENMDSLFEKRELDLLSVIETKNIKVKTDSLD